MFSIALRLAFGIAAVAAISGLAALATRIHSRGSSPEGQEAPSDYRSGLPAESVPPRPTESPPPFTGQTSGSSAHGRLILDGHFAQRIGMLAALKGVDLPGKTIRHSPDEHLSTALVNVLAGHTQLQEISRGDKPLRADLALAHAWGQRQFPEVSGVCRQLHSLDWSHAEAVREQLRLVFAPYVALCQGAAQAQGQRLVVDWDLTPKAITTDARSEPFAAYGHIEEGLGKGYQWAEAVLRGTGPDGEPRAAALGGFLRPGNAHPPECVERLRLVTEATLGQPRRRPELLEVRLAAAQAQAQQRQERLTTLEGIVTAQRARVGTVSERLRAIEQRRAAREPQQKALLGRDERARAALEERLARAQRRLSSLERRLVSAKMALAEAAQLAQEREARLERLRAENLALDEQNRVGAAIELVVDSQFGSSEIVASLLEEGYDVTTKATSPATIRKLLRRAQSGEVLFGPWQEVSANAQVAECSESAYCHCPHPLRLLGYRKELAASASRPAETRYALFLTSVSAQERTVQQTVAHYHTRGGTVELINRQAKSYLGWRGHRLRHAPGLDVLGQFVFAGLNFVPWLADTVWQEGGVEAGAKPGFAVLAQMARTAADVLADEGGVAVQFRADSGWPQRSLCLGTLWQPPLPGFVWPGVPINAHKPLQNSFPDLVARKLG